MYMYLNISRKILHQLYSKDTMTYQVMYFNKHE